MRRDLKGIERALHMRGWANRKGGTVAEPDGLDRGDPGALASLLDEWLCQLQERNYSPRSLRTWKWAMWMFLRWARERELRRPEQVDKATVEAYRGWLFHYRKADGRHPSALPRNAGGWGPCRSSSPGFVGNSGSQPTRRPPSTCPGSLTDPCRGPCQ